MVMLLSDDWVDEYLYLLSWFGARHPLSGIVIGLTNPFETWSVFLHSKLNTKHEISLKRVKNLILFDDWIDICELV